MDSDFGQRAKERRMRLVGGTARSFAELDEAGANYWSQAQSLDLIAAKRAAGRERDLRDLRLLEKFR